MAVTGFTLISIQRTDRLLQGNMLHTAQAKWSARAGVELGLVLTEQVSDWRQRVVNNELITDFAVGDGEVSVRMFDDGDGNLTNSAIDAVRLLSVGSFEGAECRLQAQLKARPHAALRYALFASGSDDLKFSGIASCRGPVRAHGNITAAMSNVVRDDASFETMTGYTINDPLTPKSYVSTAIAPPTPDLSYYLALATVITAAPGGACELKGHNLTPTSNPSGTPNPNGIYALNAEGREVVITDLHVKGTLIVYNTGHAVTLSGGCWFEPGPLNYPVLLIDTPQNEVYLSPTQAKLDESKIGLYVNILGVEVFIGSGVDYNEDGDCGDKFDTQINGVVWTNATRVRLDGFGWPFIGCLIASRIEVEHEGPVDNDLRLLDTLTPGFIESGMKVASMSYTEVAP
ncbi:MAG: hypothetical protein AMXMBFR13_48100 [Phycisphaerae bacterium]